MKRNEIRLPKASSSFHSIEGIRLFPAWRIFCHDLDVSPRFVVWEIVNEGMALNDFGKIADECWRAIPEHFPNVELGAYVIMPNHVHGIILIHESHSSSVGAQHAAPLQRPNVKPGSLGTIVRSFKSAVTRRIGRKYNATGIWQRNYYEHVIRNHEDWDRIHRYIDSNPSLWAEDEENPLNM